MADEEGKPVGKQDDYGASTKDREHNASESFRAFADNSTPRSGLDNRPPLRYSRARRKSSAPYAGYDVPDIYSNLDETIGVFPVQNRDEQSVRYFRSLEQVRTQEQEHSREQRVQSQLPARDQPEREKPEEVEFDVSRLLTQLYTVSYLILFSILGTLARLGLQALTTYPGAPTIFSSIWPNFAGSLVMGFLSEDRKLFYDQPNSSTRQNRKRRDEEDGGNPSDDSSTANSPPVGAGATKKTIPLYIGLATGFCGSFTSFSAFIRDMFLTLSNDLSTTISEPTVGTRNGGYSFLALLAVLLTTLSLSLSALFLGAHLAIALQPILPSLPPRPTRRVLDRVAAILGWGCWLGAAAMSVWPPDRDPGPSVWRGAAMFALVFAPLGCLLRFFVSLKLNGRLAGFPLGTFVANVLGTAVLAMAWDLSHSSPGPAGGGGLVACQVLKGGIQDGFCGCLTTVSTWVAEMTALRRKHAYVYGGASVVAGLAVAVAIMGGWRWSPGFEGGSCG
ncbi:putative fluoride ion transporter CrcB [Madurella mycetomatis]|uniref:Fluoride ion transporter CrcB n=1 Tax=Madurella mycetomatis TaxID=100816 RepID=A0A175W5N4_9PEZI|nr:putative fluoride ion transporter CrcB [Madurella mycetomatis]